MVRQCECACDSEFRPVVSCGSVTLCWCTCSSVTEVWFTGMVLQVLENGEPAADTKLLFVIVLPGPPLSQIRMP